MATERIPDKITASDFKAKWDRGEFVKGKKGKIQLGNVKRASEVAPPKKSKYNNVKVEDPETGKIVHSTLELKHRKEYRKKLRESGLIDAMKREIAGYGFQVEFILTGGITYIADHVFIMPDQTIQVIDTKGMPATPDAQMKKKLMKADYGIDVVYRKK